MAVLGLVLTLPLLLASGCAFVFLVRRRKPFLAGISTGVGLFAAWVTASIFLHPGY